LARLIEILNRHYKLWPSTNQGA